MGQYDFRAIMTRRAEWKGDVLQFHDAIRDVVNGLEQEIESAVLNHFDMDFTDLREYLRDKEEWKRKQAEAISRNMYTAHEVAEILAEVIGDDCACDVNRNDEWLPEFCEFSQTVCPYPAGVACWEQWLKWREKRPKEENDDLD